MAPEGVAAGPEEHESVDLRRPPVTGHDNIMFQVQILFAFYSKQENYVCMLY